MTRILLASSAAVAAALSLSPAAQAQGCNTLRSCTTFVCGREVEEGCGPVDRCYYWTDYPTCVYPTVEPVCVYPYDGGWCVPWEPTAR